MQKYVEFPTLIQILTSKGIYYFDANIICKSVAKLAGRTYLGNFRYGSRIYRGDLFGKRVVCCLVVSGLALDVKSADISVVYAMCGLSSTQ